MNQMITKFNDFLNDMKKSNHVLVESIQKAFNAIHESTEDRITRLKDKHPKREKMLEDEFSDVIPEEVKKPEPEIPVEPIEEESSLDDDLDKLFGE